MRGDVDSLFGSTEHKGKPSMLASARLPEMETLKAHLKNIWMADDCGLSESDGRSRVNSHRRNRVALIHQLTINEDGCHV